MKCRALLLLCGVSCFLGLSGNLVAGGDASPMPSPQENASPPKAPSAGDLVEAALEDCRPVSKPPVTSSGPPANKDAASPPSFGRILNIADYYSPPGVATVVVLVDSSGNGRFAHLIGSLPPKSPPDLAAAALRFARESRYVPGKVDGRPVTMWKRFFISFGGIRLGHIFDKRDIDKWLKAARDGDDESIVILNAIHRVDVIGASLTPNESRHFLVRSAFLGDREAQVDLALMLRPSECHKRPEVKQVLHDLIWKGNSNAELEEAAAELMSNDFSSYRETSILLHGAANARDPFVQMWAAGILATAPVPEVRDPEAALATALTLTEAATDPDYAEVVAAAQAASGHFDESIRAQEIALALAKNRRWNVTQIQLRLETYRSRRPWTGYLCDCTDLSPEGHSPPPTGSATRAPD